MIVFSIVIFLCLVIVFMLVGLLIIMMLGCGLVVSIVLISGGVLK